MQISNWYKKNTTAHSFNHVWRANQNEVTFGKLQSSYNQNRKHEGTNTIHQTPTDKQLKIADKTYSELIDDFWSRTTIQGIVQIGTRKNYIWKFLWIFVALSGAAMAMYQSRDVLQDYYGKSTIQKLTFKSKDAPFPAVTICKTIKVKSPISEPSSNSDEAPDHDLWINETYDPKDGLSYIQKCKFGTISCNFTNEDDIFPWSNPKYGSCFTFNAGFNDIKTLDTAAGLHLIIGMTDYPESSELSDFTIIIIHQSKTPPSLYSAQYTVINPKVLMTIKLKARELVKLEGSTDCLLPNSNYEKKYNFYYSKGTPYIYTTPSCQKSCEISRRQKKFNCLDPSAVINATRKGNNALPLKYCNYTEVTYDVDQDFKQLCTGTCLLACRETLLEDVKATSTTVCKQSTSGNDSETASCAVIKISYGNVPYEIIEEKRKYSDADFWGIIGGNVGLWVGICIISLFEIIELAVTIAWSLLKNKMHLYKKPKKVKGGMSRLRRFPIREFRMNDEEKSLFVDITRRKF